MARATPTGTPVNRTIRTVSSVAVECRHDDIAVHIESRRRKNGTVGRKYDDDIIVLNINNNYGIEFVRNNAFNSRNIIKGEKCNLFINLFIFENLYHARYFLKNRYLKVIPCKLLINILMVTKPPATTTNITLFHTYFDNFDLKKNAKLMSLRWFCIVDPSKTFWDDPKMYVDDPGLDTLLSLTVDELLPCDGQDDETSYDDEDSKGNLPDTQRPRQPDRPSDVKQVLECTYPNCDKTYLKPSHLKVNNYYQLFLVRDWCCA
ncbi:hypothetical protein QTP88_007137 [Uroleucon formosanum]